MPLVEYQCEDCKKVHQVLEPREKVPDKCECGGKLKKLINKLNFWFK